MPVIYAKSNQESTFELFYNRISYYNVLQQTAATYSNLVDFNFGEKYLYGRVNRLFVPIILNQSMLSLKVFDKTVAAEKTLSAAAFVVDAFNGSLLNLKDA